MSGKLEIEVKGAEETQEIQVDTVIETAKEIAEEISQGKEAVEEIKRAGDKVEEANLITLEAIYQVAEHIIDRIDVLDQRLDALSDEVMTLTQMEQAEATTVAVADVVAEEMADEILEQAEEVEEEKEPTPTQSKKRKWL